jgi:hypothetical protein
LKTVGATSSNLEKNGPGEEAFWVFFVI